MKQLVSINGIRLTAKWFAYDGYHKIYTLENEREKQEALSYGLKVLPISKIRTTFKHSCQKRYIDSWNLEREYVPQFSSARRIRWEYEIKSEEAI